MIIVAIIAAVVAFNGGFNLQKVGEKVFVPEIPDAPNASSTQADMAKYVEYLAGLSVEGSMIDVTDCAAPVPLVLRTDLTETISFQNTGSTSVLVQIPPFAAFSVAPKGEFEIPAKVVKGKGVWPITCGERERAGFVYIP